MKVSLLNVLTICGAVILAANTADARRIRVFRDVSGRVSVTDLEDGKTYYPKDVNQFVKENYLTSRQVQGFGNPINSSEFSKGQTVTAPVKEVARDTVQKSTGVPVIGRLMKPVSKLIGKPDYPSR